MDRSPSELAPTSGLANRSHCHMYRNSLPDTHTHTPRSYLTTHTHSYPPASQVSGKGSHTHTGRDAEAHLISQEQRSEEARVALGISHLFGNLDGLVRLAYVFDLLK